MSWNKIYWVHIFRDSLRIMNPPIRIPPRCQPKALADPDTCNIIYRALLTEWLELSPAHRDQLGKVRGIPQHLIEMHRFRTWPRPDQRPDIARLLAKKFGVKAVLGVPGFRLTAGRLTLAGPEGPAIAIPCVDLAGKVRAIRLRHDDPNPSRYTWVSTPSGGVGVQSLPFWSPGLKFDYKGVPHAEFVRLLEGEFKAVISAAHTGVFSIAVPGVGLWRLALPVLEAVGATRVHLAFDQDWREKTHVARAIVDAREALRRQGMSVELSTWPGPYKGFDDYLLSLTKSEEVA